MTCKACPWNTAVVERQVTCPWILDRPPSRTLAVKESLTLLAQNLASNNIRRSRSALWNIKRDSTLAPGSVSSAHGTGQRRRQHGLHDLDHTHRPARSRLLIQEAWTREADSLVSSPARCYIRRTGGAALLLPIEATKGRCAMLGRKGYPHEQPDHRIERRFA